MTKAERESYIISIENSADIINAALGPEIINHIFAKYHAHGLWDLPITRIPSVFNEFHDIESGLR